MLLSDFVSAEVALAAVRSARRSRVQRDAVIRFGHLLGPDDVTHT